MTSSTFDNDESMMTRRAASDVTSPCCPNAMPTVDAISAGASLIPSPMKTVCAAAVARRKEHPREPVLRAQVADEPQAIVPRDVVKPERRRVVIVDDDDAFEAGGLAGRQIESAGRVRAARDQHDGLSHLSAQPDPGFLTNPRDLELGISGRRGRAHERAG